MAVPLGGADPMLAMQKAAMLPRGTTRPGADGASEGVFSFGWTSDATAAATATAAAAAQGGDGDGGHADGTTGTVPARAARTVELGAEAWMVLRVASAPGIAEIFAAMAGAAGPEPATTPAWEMLLAACKAKLLALPAVGHGDGVMVAPEVAAATVAQQELLEAAVAAARAALACA